jgi:hypothetical protein
MLAYVEAFWVMGVVFLLMLPFLPLLQYSKAARAAKAAPELDEQITIPVGSPEIELKALERHAHDEEEHFSSLTLST